jgi:hypothetical protein
VALNERGDVVGNATTTGGEPAVLLWRAADRAHPVVITGQPYLSATDIDDDGTILVNSFPNSSFLRPTSSRGGIRNGQVAGQYVTADQLHGDGVRWRSAGRAMGPLPLAGVRGRRGEGGDDDGTIAGAVSDRDPEAYSGRPVVWRYSLR